MATDIPDRVRKLVYDRDHHRCRWCGRTNVALHIHHVDYRSAGGKHVPDNLVSLCYQHHELVHTNKGYYPQLLRQLLEAGPGITGYQLERRTAEQERVVVPFRARVRT